jgi:hypothetical protein
MKIYIFSPEPIGEAFTRNHLVISMHQSVGLEVKGTPRAFPNWAIADGLCLSARRHK